MLAELSDAFSESPESDADDPDDDTQPTHAGGTESGARTTIQIGGDDGAGDAVYLDEELASSGDDADPVFIDDDGTGDALPAKDAAGIEPRLRQRRIGVRRAESRKRLRILALLVAGIMLVVAALATLGSGLFSVEDVDVAGQQFADADAVAAVVDDLIGQPVLLVDTEAAEERLARIPFVESARVRTEFPGSVRIELRERVPVATAQGSDGRFRILDADGRVLVVIDGQPIEFALIESPVPLDLGAGAFAPEGIAAAGALSVKLTPEIRSRLISLFATPDGSDLRLTLSNEPFDDFEVRLGAAVTDEDQFERLVRLQRQLDDVAGRDVSVLDVSTSEVTQR
ncbi:MAG: cell division protein FtsQ/DivIB [Ilumatobacter sp.]